MKKLFLLFLITGCEYYVDPDRVAIAAKYCEAGGGLSRVLVSMHTIEGHCKDNTVVVVPRVK